MSKRTPAALAPPSRAPLGGDKMKLPDSRGPVASQQLQGDLFGQYSGGHREPPLQIMPDQFRRLNLKIGLSDELHSSDLQRLAGDQAAWRRSASSLPALCDRSSPKNRVPEPAAQLIDTTAFP